MTVVFARLTIGIKATQKSTISRIVFSATDRIGKRHSRDTESMPSRAHSRINLILPPVLAARLSPVILKKVERKLLTDKAFFFRVMVRADLLETIVFDDEISSWGPWPLWLNEDGLELCGAIGLLLGIRLEIFLKDRGLVDADLAKNLTGRLIRRKEDARFDRRDRREEERFD
jgi:hypothetical protein